MKKRFLPGLLCVVGGSVSFGLLSSVQNGILLSGADPEGMLATCYCLVFLGVFLATRIRRLSLRVTARQLWQLALLGVLGLGMTDLLLNTAYTMIPVGFASMIHFLFPSIVCVAMTLLFHQRMTRLKVLAILFSVTGLAVLANGALAGSPLGILAAACSSLTYGFYMIANERLEIVALPLAVRLTYTSLFMVLFYGALSLARHASFPSGGNALGLCVLSAALIGSGTLLITGGVGKLGASTASFINMLEPVVSLMTSALVYRYAVSAQSLLGCALILCSVAFIAWNDRFMERGGA